MCKTLRSNTTACCVDLVICWNSKSYPSTNINSFFMQNCLWSFFKHISWAFQQGNKWQRYFRSQQRGRPVLQWHPIIRHWYNLLVYSCRNYLRNLSVFAGPVRFYRAKQLCGLGNHNSVRPSVRPSATCILCGEKKKTYSWNFDIAWKSNQSSFFIPKGVCGDVRFNLKFALKLTHPHLKNSDFDHYLFITSQP